MPVLYSNHLCVVGSQGRAAAGGASGRMEKRLDSPGRKSETRRVRGLGCHCQTTRSLRDCGSAACTRSPFLLPNSQKHLHAPPPDLLDLWTSENPPNKIRVKKTDAERKVWQTSKFSSYFTLSCAHFRRTPDWNNKSTLRLWPVIICVSTECFLWYLTAIIHTCFFHYKCTSSTSFGRFTVLVDLRRLTRALQTD